MSTAARPPVLLDRIDRLPTSAPTTPVRTDAGARAATAAPSAPPGAADGTRLAVADLALDGCLLGAYADVYPVTGGWWERALHAVALYAGVPEPRWRRENLDEDLERNPFRDESPVAEAVLRLVHAGGLRALTLDRVARASGRDPDWILSMHGSVEGLVDALLDRVAEEAFDELVPVHATEPSVSTTLTAFASSHRLVAMLRFLALTGVEVPADVAADVGRASPVVHDLADLPDGALVAALAVDAWQLGSATDGYPWPAALAPDVVAELRRLATG